MPKGMRETLYFKDDDSRLSFLQGNYVTLTNMKDKDIELDHQVQIGTDQYFCADNESGTAVQDAPQPVCRGSVKEDRSSLRGGNPDEWAGGYVQEPE